MPDLRKGTRPVSDVVSFLRARLDEDEQIARAASDLGASWYVDGRTGEVAAVQPDPEPGDSAVLVTCDSYGLSAAVEEEQAVHIARHDPACVLRDVEAKRRIIDLCDTEIQGDTDGAVTASSTLYLLALPYADHDDYLEEWKP